MKERRKLQLGIENMRVVVIGYPSVFKFASNVHNYWKNQEMLWILKYFSFLCQLKGYKASNKLVTKDFDLKFGHKNGFLADPEALCMCPFSFDFSFLNSKLSSEKIKELFINLKTFDFGPRYLPTYIDMGDFPPNDILGVCRGSSPNISFTS